MYWLYSALLLVSVLAASPYFIYQTIRYGKYISNFRQRLGLLPASLNREANESIWIHAVSVGEALTARALIPELRERYPHLRLFVSTTTVTGQQVARDDLQQVDGVFYCPFDLTFIVNRTLKLVRPKLFITVDTEIWPNLLRACRRHDVKTMLVNGRMSSRSYARYRVAGPFFRRVLADVDHFCVQSEESARRLIDLGAPPAKVTITGSLKFETLTGVATAPGQVRDRVLRFFRISERRPVLIAASTRRGEEAPVFRAFRRIQQRTSDALLIVAPRHPERFAEVEQLARRMGFTVARRSDLPIDAEPRAEVVVLDTIGELARLYQVATTVFVGGSLVNAGGHNILEPAVFGKPITFGPHMENFSEIAEAFVRSGAACQVQSDRELEELLLSLLTDPVRRAALGAAARALVEANRGAKVKSLAAVAELLPPASAESTPGVVRPFRAVH